MDQNSPWFSIYSKTEGINSPLSNSSNEHRRCNRKPPMGNNSYGRKGTLRCEPCRRRRRKVPLALKSAHLVRLFFARESMRILRISKFDSMHQAMGSEKRDNVCANRDVSLSACTNCNRLGHLSSGYSTPPICLFGRLRRWCGHICWKPVPQIPVYVWALHR